MSANAVAIVAVSLYAPIYFLLVWTVPRKKGIGFVSKLRVHYSTTDWSFWLEWMQATFSIGTVVLYVVNSYYAEASYLSLALKLEVFFAVFYAFNYFLELLLSKNRWAYIMSLLGIVDVVTTAPLFVTLVTGELDNSPTGFVRFYRVLMLSRVFKPFRLLRAVETLSPGKDAVMEQTAKTIAHFVATLFLATGLVQVLSEDTAQGWGDISVTDSQPMAFHDALYFIIVTFSTVGYGDISPPDTQSRLAIILLVGFFFFMIPRELNTLNQLLDLSSKYTGHYPRKLCGGHTIVGCDVATCGLVAAFLEEFFHEDHGYNAMHLVLLVPHEPTMEWKRLVLKFAANDRVTYLKGDLRSTADLHRVSAQTASSCFVLANRHGNLREEEKRGFMRAISVQDFNPSIHIFVEALTDGMRQRLIKVGINPARIVCASTINTHMLANACAWEGASTLINNLLVSASIDEQRDMPCWVKEYAGGLGKEIYVVSIGAFAGRGFSALVLELFQQHGVVLLGISEDHRVFLHPGAGYVVTSDDLGFLVADDVDVAESIVKQAGALLPFVPSNTKGYQGDHGPSSAANTSGAVAIRRCSTPKEGGSPLEEVPPHSKQRPALLRSLPGDAVQRREIDGSEGQPRTCASSSTYPQIGSRAEDAVSGGRRRKGSCPRGPSESDFMVLVTPTLAHISTVVEALEAPQVPFMECCVVCPLYEWNQDRDMDEIERLRKIPQVRLVVGPPSEAVLRMAEADSANMVVVRTGRSFPEQETSDADAETIGQIVEVTAAAGPRVRAVVELNDMNYGHHYETLIDRLRCSTSASSQGHASPRAEITFAARGASADDRDDLSLWKRFLRRCGHTPSAHSRDDDGRRRSTEGRVHNTQGAYAAASAAPGIESTESRGHSHWTLSKGFASGGIVPSSLPETLLCQAYYNPAIIMIVEALLDPKAQNTGRFPAEDDGVKHENAPAPSSCECEDEGGGASFLAQMAPPKRFFQQAMLSGDRPNFQALMTFMLAEYDALPFGLLRHIKQERHQPAVEAEATPKFVQCCPPQGQKVMPSDKVFLLAPNLDSWARMQQDSPSSVPLQTLGSPTPRLTPPPSDETRGFPRAPVRVPQDERGFPLGSCARRPKQRGSRMDVAPAQGDATCVPRTRNLFPSPFGSSPPRAKAEPTLADGVSQDLEGATASWLRPTPTVQRAGASSARGISPGHSWTRETSRADASCASRPQKGSHAKLDLLLREVQLLNERLDAALGPLRVQEGGVDARDISVAL